MISSILFKYRRSSVKGKPGSIYVQITKDRSVVAITLKGHKVLPEEWDATNECFITKTTESKYKLYLEDLHKRMVDGKRQLIEIACELELTHNPYTIEDVLDIYRKRKTGHSITAYTKQVIQTLEAEYPRTAESYLGAINKLKAFVQATDIALEKITPELVKQFEQHILRLGNNANTSSYYLRNLRAIFNRAVDDNLLARPAENPFAGVFTGNMKTEKRAVPEEVIDQITTTDLPDTSLADIRNLLLLSYYLRGISFIDLAYLKKENIQGNKLVYTRHKTGQRIEVEIEQEIKELLDLYHSDDSDYLLPILRQDDSRKAYKNALKRMNQGLKKLSAYLQLNIRLTTYVARHSWASIAYARGVSIDLISLGLGHESVKTTMIYLKSFDYSSLHAANRRVISNGKNSA